MAVCPGCSVSGNYYTKTGDKIQKYFKYIKLDLKPLMTIECCPTCAKPPLPLFASNSMTRYSELKKTLEVVQAHAYLVANLLNSSTGCDAL